MRKFYYTQPCQNNYSIKNNNANSYTVNHFCVNLEHEKVIEQILASYFLQIPVWQVDNLIVY